MLHLIAASLLLLGAHAAPQEVERRQATTSTCNADNCFRAVFGTRLSTRNAEGTAACQSFFQKTVSPCVFTATSTVTTSTTFTTIKATTTPTTTTTLSMIKTSTISAETTVTQNPMKHKREAKTLLHVAERAVTPTCPTTMTNSATPVYASACTGTRFSSACACAGVTPPPAMTLSTITSTTTITFTSSFSTTTTITASTVTMTETTFTGTTTTTVFTSTATVTPSFRGISCTDIDSAGSFGRCDSDPDNCLCDRREQSGSQRIGVCDADDSCRTPCGSDMDCPMGQACAKGGYFAGCPGGSSCVDYTVCKGPSSMKRDVPEGNSSMPVGGDVFKARLNGDGSVKFPH